MVKLRFWQRLRAQAACLQCQFLGRWADISDIRTYASSEFLSLPLPAWHHHWALPPLPVLCGISARNAGWKSRGKIRVAASFRCLSKESKELSS